MTNEDITRMAREAGFGVLLPSPDYRGEIYGIGEGTITDEMERFAALVAAHVRETEFKPDWNNYQQGLIDGAAAEREACARIAEEAAVTAVAVTGSVTLTVVTAVATPAIRTFRVGADARTFNVAADKRTFVTLTKYVEDRIAAEIRARGEK